MQKSNRVYNPQISLKSYNILKRLSWFNSLPMTKTLDMVIEEALQLYNLKMVCQSCRADKKECKGCRISKHF